MIMDLQRLKDLARIDESPTGKAFKSVIIVRDEVESPEVIESADNLWWEVTVQDLWLQVVGASTGKVRRFFQEKWAIYPPNAKADAIKDATQRFNKLKKIR